MYMSAIKSLLWVTCGILCLKASSNELDLEDQAMYYANPDVSAGFGYALGQGFGFGYEYNYPSQPLQSLANLGSGFGYYGYEPFTGGSIRYGDGGYGDSQYVHFNPNVCVSNGQQNCTAVDPDAYRLEWKFIPNIGWRKMAPYSAARKDWWDYKRSVPLPFNYYNFWRF